MIASPKVETVRNEGPVPDERRASPQVKAFHPGLVAQWDEFVISHPQGTLFHLTAWKRALEGTLPFQASYFYAERDGRITGVAPLFLVSNWVVGRCLISVPLAAYGGICAEDAESENLLRNHVQQVAAEQQVDFLELRNRSGGLLPGFHSNSLYSTFRCPLSPDPQEILKRLPRDTRYMIRKAEKAGLKARNGLDQLEVFYPLFAESYRRLGTPVFPKALLENLVSEFPGQVDLLVVYAGERPVSGVFSFFYRDIVLPYYAGASSEAGSLAANNFMYAALMKQAGAAGYRTFDFGRSKKGTGSHAFKMQWNMDVESLDYQVHLVRRKTVPNFSPLNPKFQVAAQVWKRLPFWLTLRMGPRVVRWFP